MIELTAEEARVLGVLVEKAMTTPEQYPLSLNAIVAGANQKNNRDPVMEMDEDDAFAAVEGLRGKGLAVQFAQPGMRVHKYKHAADAKLGLNPRQMAVVAELLLRGPQTAGEIRGRATRMYALESMEVVKSVLQELMARPEPLVREVPGGRAERYQQLLAPEVVGEEGVAEEAEGTSEGAAPAPKAPAAGLADRVAKLEAEVGVLREALRKLAAALGETDPTQGG